MLANETAKYFVNLYRSDEGELHGLCWVNCCGNAINSCIRGERIFSERIGLSMGKGVSMDEKDWADYILLGIREFGSTGIPF